MSNAKKNTAKTRKQTPGHYAHMNARQLAKATEEFDEEFVIDETRPLTKDEKRQWQKARRKRGRPKVGRGVKVIAVSLEQGLLAKADRRAKQLAISRSKLIARGLEIVLADGDGK